MIATVVSFLTLFFGLRFIVGPLRLLAERAQRIGAGDYAAIGEPVGGVGEIEALRRAIDQMAEQIKRYQAGLETYLLAITRAQEEERARLSRGCTTKRCRAIAFDHKIQKIQRTLDRDPRWRTASWRNCVIFWSMPSVRSGASARRCARSIWRTWAWRRRSNCCPPSLQPALHSLGEPRRLAPRWSLHSIGLPGIAQQCQAACKRYQVEVTLTFQPEQSKLTICDEGRV